MAAGAVTGPAVPRPAIVLVEPQLGENIGAAARAMLNFGLDDLRLVRPRDGWPNPVARANAAGAARVVENTTVFDGSEAALADCRLVFAATARPRDMAVRAVDPETAGAMLREAARRGESGAVMFGKESTGLDNDAVALADAIVTAPCDPAFTSLNLAMAVLLVAYEWGRAAAPAAPPRRRAARADKAADKAQLLRLFEHLESALGASGFFRPPQRRPRTTRKLRALIQRAQPSESEVRMMRGVVHALAGEKGARPRRSGERPRPRAAGVLQDTMSAAVAAPRREHS